MLSMLPTRDTARPAPTESGGVSEAARAVQGARLRLQYLVTAAYAMPERGSVAEAKSLRDE